MTWAEDRATLGSDLSAVSGAQTEAGQAGPVVTQGLFITPRRHGIGGQTGVA